MVSAFRRRRVAYVSELLAGRRAQPVPDVAHLLIVGLRLIARGRQPKALMIDPAHGAQQRVGRDEAVALRRDQT